MPIGRKTIQQRRELGKSLRKRVPRTSHAEWSPGSTRPEPVGLLEQQNKERLGFLVPVRRARMMASPFAFYRGAAKVMAADLATTPVSGLAVQTCGDPIAIAGYLGSNDTYDRALTEFAERYADQNERDYEAFLEAIHSGKLEATSEPC